MVNRLCTFSFSLIALFLSGCGSKDPLVLLKPGETQAWRTAQDVPDASSLDRTRLLVETNMGSFVIELFDNEAPVSTTNFLNYADTNFYDGTIFHRVIPGFMVQGGGFTEDLELKETDTSIANEAGNGLKNLRGTLAMARTNDVNSANSQFFINVVNNPFLNGDGVKDGYAVFGRVYEGMDVVDRIAQVETSNQNGMDDVPVEPVMILSVERI